MNLRPLVNFCLLAALAGCTTNPRLQDARAFAADTAKLDSYADLSERFRDTYTRERPYLSVAADARERPANTERHTAFADFMAIHDAVVQYMHTLGRLAGGDTFSLDAPLKSLGGSIKAWPDAGLDSRHVNAYSGLARVLARAATQREQDNAVRQMVHDAEPHLQLLLDAMQRLLRYYDKSSDNERAIVLGTLDVELPFADTPRDRLLAVLAKAHRLGLAQEYRQAGLRHTLAIKHVAAIAAAHTALLQRMEAPDNAMAANAPQQASGPARGSADSAPRPATLSPLDQP
ncbi:hypothetical protein GCM10027277_53080 [Pseudoduganella ginsengisoli]|uniref:hypothetical protein n=1 Tax=Pseudoduganella ginsengisoli TaxID=1462440 RepID=UPI001BA92B26|nr:hypothetical protein [Pseudoduganella ginsengisoli]